MRQSEHPDTFSVHRNSACRSTGMHPCTNFLPCPTRRSSVSNSLHPNGTDTHYSSRFRACISGTPCSGISLRSTDRGTYFCKSLVICRVDTSKLMVCSGTRMYLYGRCHAAHQGNPFSSIFPFQSCTHTYYRRSQGYQTDKSSILSRVTLASYTGTFLHSKGLSSPIHTLVLGTYIYPRHRFANLPTTNEWLRSVRINREYDRNVCHRCIRLFLFLESNHNRYNSHNFRYNSKFLGMDHHIGQNPKE